MDLQNQLSTRLFRTLHDIPEWQLRPTNLLMVRWHVVHDDETWNNNSWDYN